MSAATTSLYSDRRRWSTAELAIAVAIVTVLAGVLLARFDALMVDVERVDMQRTENRIRAALGLAVAERVARGQLAAAAGLAGSNPVDLLQSRPANYLGVLTHADAGNVEPGWWYFDAGSGRLVYRVEHSNVFETTLKGPARAEFAIRLRYADNNRDGRYEAAGDALYGVDFAPVAPFRWTTGEARTGAPRANR